MAIASLGMYSLPAVEKAIADWWRGLAAAMAAEGITDVPRTLADHMPLEEAWLSPDLLFAQTCGYPLTHLLKDRVTLLATPLYDCPDVTGADYCSLIMVRDDDPATDLADLRGRRAVINGTDSQSGFSALRHAVAPLAREGRFFSSVGVSGAHRASLAWVRDGKADVCATDSVMYHLLACHQPAALAGLRCLQRTVSAPGLPYITRLDGGDDLVQRLRAALFAACAAPDLAAARADLMIGGVKVLPPAAYQVILDIEQQAVDLGYPVVN